MLPEIVKRPGIARLKRRGFILEGITLGWNVVGVGVLAVASITAGSVALAGFGLDSLIEIGASTVVIWELFGAGERRQRFALRLIATPLPVGGGPTPWPAWSSSTTRSAKPWPSSATITDRSGTATWVA